MSQRRRNTDERGAAAVEFALIVPLLLLLVTGIMEFSFAFNRQQGIHAAAREGARLGSIPTVTQSDIEEAVDRALTGVTLDTPVTITIEPNTAVPCLGAESIVVTVITQSTIEVAFANFGTISQRGRGEFVCES